MSIYSDLKFDSAVEYVLNNEGGLVNNPHDPGGITNFGISLRFLKSISVEKLKTYGIFSEESEDIVSLTKEQAKAIYRGEFWEHCKFDNINDQDCCNYIFDMAVNMGISPAIKCTQRACWAVMGKKDAIVDDGILGEKTLTLINYLLRHNCGLELLYSMRSERAGYYRLISLDGNNKEFLNGWLRRAYG